MKLSDHILRKPFHVAFGQALSSDGITSIDLVATRDATAVTITASDGSAAPIAGADASNAGVMTAADKSKLDGLSIATTQDFPTRLDVAAAVIDAGTTHLRTAGHSVAGDDGAALYKRVASAPSHALKVQSADGAWWEIVPDKGSLSFQSCGGIEGDNAANGAGNVAAFNNFIGYVQTLPAAGLYVGGLTLLFPVGDYHFNTHLNVKATIRMKGVGGWGLASQAGAKLHFPLDSHGIIVHRHDTIDATTQAATFFGDGTIIEGLFLKGGGNTGATGSGIWMRARALVRDCYIREFAEDGVRIVATFDLAFPATHGNANLWRLEGVLVAQNGGNGVFVKGGDANAGYAVAVDATSNGRWGIHDSGFLGNTFLQCHTAGNGQATIGGNPAGSSSVVEQGGNQYSANAGATEAQLVATTPGTDEAVWIFNNAGGSGTGIPTWLAAQPEGTYFHGGSYHADNANGHTTFIGCYREGGQGINQIAFPSVAYGGIMAPNRGSGVSLEGNTWSGSMTFSNQQTFFEQNLRDFDLKINPAGHKLLRAVADGDDPNGINLVAWSEADGHYLICEHGSAGSRRPIQITSNLNIHKHGRAAVQPGGELILWKGMWIGPGPARAKFFKGFDAKPTSGDWSRGDKVWNYNPASAGEAAGWRITTSGTLGGGAVLEEFFYAPDLPADRGAILRPHATIAKVEWRAAPKAGADTIANTASTVAVTFTTAYPNANYSVALSADGDERVWVTAKTTTGFTLNRAATAGARAIDWTATPHEDL